MVPPMWHSPRQPFGWLLCFLVAAAGCATSSYNRAWVSDELSKSSGHVRPDTSAEEIAAQTPELPPGMPADAGLDEATAVAIALWNSAQLQADLANLGASRADLAEAGALPNPTFSLLLPAGPRTIETSLLLPVAALIQRPARVSAARLQVEQVARGLVQNGLDLARDVRIAHAEWVLAEGRRQERERLVSLWRRTAELMRARLEAGDASRVEVSAADADAATAQDTADRTKTDASIALQRLRLMMGLSDSPLLEDVAPIRSSTSARPGRELPDLEQLALAARPDFKAAELTVASNAERLGWERWRILSLLARIDGKPTTIDGQSSLVWVPGFQTEVPIFNLNPGGIGRAEAELQRAAHRYALQRQTILNEVRVAHAQLLQASRSLELFRTTVVPALEQASDGVQKGFAAGETPYLQVLEVLRRLGEARLRALELEAELCRAIAQLERSVGKQGVVRG